jgi:hypothetical protein
MSAATVVNAATKLPWKQILAHLPEVVGAAKKIWKYWESKPTPEPIDPSASVASQLAALADRVQLLESNEKSQSEVVRQIAEQLQGLAAGLRETAARQTLFIRLCLGSIALASLAFAAAIVAVVARASS